MKNWWTRLPVFWKTYLLTAAIVSGVVLAVEGCEGFLGQLLSGGTEEKLSAWQETAAWIIAMLFAISVGSVLLTGLFMDPLRRLMAVAEKLAEGELSARLSEEDAARPDEIGALNRTFNAMASRLEHKFESERRLLAAVSHELRSPLTRMRVAAELLRRSGVSAEKEAYVSRLELENERMNELIGSILEYSRRESEQLLPQTVELGAVVREAAGDAAFEGQEKGCTVRTRIAEECVVQGSADMLRRALDNVLRNALRYSPKGGEIEVGLDADAHSCTLFVRDHGPGVPEKALEDLFRPFYRVEKSRDRASGGTGLGLALVEQTVRLHGGSVRAANAPDGGLSVILRLPREHSEKIDGAA